jgi:hypothetical protein
MDETKENKLGLVLENYILLAHSIHLSHHYIHVVVVV